MSEDEPPKVTFGDLDDVAMIRAIEDAFEIKLLDQETRKCFTVGDVYALILEKVPHVTRSTAPCTSAAAYYALKRALLTMRPGAPLSRDTRLRELLAPSARADWDELSRSTGFTLPRLELSLAGQGLALAFMLGATTMAVLHMIEDASGSKIVGVALAALLISILAFGAGAWFAQKLRLVGIPRHLQTLGDLAKAVAATNIAKLALANGPARDREIWASLEYIIRDQFAWKGPITPESQLVQG